MEDTRSIARDTDIALVVLSPRIMPDMGSMVEVDGMVKVSHVVVAAAGMMCVMCRGVMGMTIVSAHWMLVMLMREFNTIH